MRITNRAMTGRRLSGEFDLIPDEFCDLRNPCGKFRRQFQPQLLQGQSRPQTNDIDLMTEEVERIQQVLQADVVSGQSPGIVG